MSNAVQRARINRRRLSLLFLCAPLSACFQEPADEPVVATEPEKTFLQTHAPESAVNSFDGVHIFYDDRGQGDKTLVLVHGWNCDRLYWQLQLDFLAENFRVVSIDLAGHGDSGTNRAAWSIAGFGSDVVAVVEKLDLRNVTLVGHSMGGPVVLDAANKLGSRVERVIGVDTLRNPDTSMPAAQVTAVLDNMETDYAATVQSIVATFFVADTHARIRDFVVRDMSSSEPAVGIGALLALNAYDPMPALASLEVPLVLINSDYQPTDSELLNSQVKDFRLQEMTGVGHFVMLEDPDGFVIQLLEAMK